MKLFKLGVLVLFLLFSGFLKAQVTEQEAKAAFIERFTRFVEWPENGVSNEDSVFVITVLGENTLSSSLDDLFRLVRIKNHPVKINYTTNPENIVNADLVFICTSEEKELKHIFKLIEGKPILTISDTPGFGELGSHINMYFEGKYIRYEINIESLKGSGLKANRLLLASAKIVKSDD